MQKTVLVALLIASLGCAAQQPAKEKQQPAKRQSFSESFFYKDSAGKVHIRTIPAGTFECVAGGKSGKHNCKEIPVIVLIDGAECIAVLPYHDLKIANNKQEDEVMWKIIGPPDYTFDSTDGIKFAPIMGSDPTKVWKDYKENKDTFRWKLSKGAPASSFSHEATVWNPDKTKKCIPGDPVIANDAN